MKKLTRRQQQFLSKVLDLYTQERQPLHYAALADYIGVSKVSAYEMLRLLEEHGLIEAEYQLPENLHGPGRASVVFRPTPLAVQELARLAGGDVNQQEWATIKAHILHELEAGRVRDYDALLEELLVRIPEQHSSMIYVAEMITAIILGLESLNESAEADALRDKLREVGTLGELGLSIFAGLGMGLSVAERVNRRMGSFLLVQSGRLQSAIAQLSEENSRQVAEFTQEVMRLVKE